LDNVVRANIRIFSLRSTVSALIRVLALGTAPVLVEMTFHSVDGEPSIITDLKR
jgi:hypothetical protein